MTFRAIAVAAALTAAQLPPQSGPPVDPEARFEVVSFKSYDPSTPPRAIMSPGRFAYDGLNASALISFGLRVQPNRIIGAPNWTDRYAVSEKAADGRPPSMSEMTTMIENMVKDRFKLVTHTETREMPVYNVVFAREDKRYGPGLKESSAECLAKIEARAAAIRRGDPPIAGPGDDCRDMRVNPGIIGAKGYQMGILVSLLTPLTGRQVVDKTGLTSYYDINLKWTPEPGAGGVIAAPGTTPPPPDPDAPNLFTALQEQLGLKLESARGPVEVLVIDKAEKPVLD